MDNLTETKLTSEKIYSGCILDFYRDTVRLPNGGTAPRELSRHVGAVCIVFSVSATFNPFIYFRF